MASIALIGLDILPEIFENCSKENDSIFRAIRIEIKSLAHACFHQINLFWLHSNHRQIIHCCANLFSNGDKSFYKFEKIVVHKSCVA